MILLLLACTAGFSTWASSDYEPLRPKERFFFIGDFSTGNPFGWDTDTVQSTARMRSSAVVFELERGVDVEIREITVTCGGGRVCDRMRGVDVRDGRAIRVWFNRDLYVESITVKAKPKGISVPPPKVNVYLQAADRF